MRRGKLAGLRFVALALVATTGVGALFGARTARASEAPSGLTLPGEDVGLRVVDSLFPEGHPARELARLRTPAGFPGMMPGLSNLPNRYADAARGIFHLNTTHFPPNTTRTFSGTVLIEDDWRIDGVVEFVDAEIVFAGDHEIVVGPEGALSITGASAVHDLDDDPVTGGIIASYGDLVIDGTTAEPIPIRSTFVEALSPDAGVFPTAIVRHARFSAGTIGFASDNSAAVVERSSFTGFTVAAAMLADARDTAGVNSRPTLSDNRFVENKVGVLFARGGDPSTDATDSSGIVRRSEFQANVLGVWCAGRGGSTAAVPYVAENNFRNHWGEAYLGYQGVTIPTPYGNLVIPDSRCFFDRNYVAPGESTVVSGEDTVQDGPSVPISNEAPDSPVPVTIVTTTKSVNGLVLEGPLIVDDGGRFTLNGTLDA
ncbi:MAG: hypothetical protein ACREQY_18790, partial [Candidatus Binatia bacterium]